MESSRVFGTRRFVLIATGSGGGIAAEKIELVKCRLFPVEIIGFGMIVHEIAMTWLHENAAGVEIVVARTRRKT